MHGVGLPFLASGYVHVVREGAGRGPSFSRAAGVAGAAGTTDAGVAGAVRYAVVSARVLELEELEVLLESEGHVEGGDGAAWRTAGKRSAGTTTRDSMGAAAQ
jgi:hypothetical protein